MRPHVLAVLPALNGGGAERVTVNLMSGLAQKGVRVELLTIVHGSRYQDRLHQSISYNLVQSAGAFLIALINNCKSEAALSTPSVLLQIEIMYLCIISICIISICIMYAVGPM